MSKPFNPLLDASATLPTAVREFRSLLIQAPNFVAASQDRTADAAAEDQAHQHKDNPEQSSELEQEVETSMILAMADATDRDNYEASAEDDSHRGRRRSMDEIENEADAAENQVADADAPNLDENFFGWWPGRR
jgi:hypothetical protein